MTGVQHLFQGRLAVSQPVEMVSRAVRPAVPLLPVALLGEESVAEAGSTARCPVGRSVEEG